VSEPHEIRLDPVAGPYAEPFCSGERTAFGLGRSPTSALHLDHKAVSRSHAIFQQQDDAWFITDLDSRHGTAVNGEELKAWVARPLDDGDLVRIWPWTFRVGLGETERELSLTMDDTVGGSVVTTESLGAASHTQELLDLLMRCTAELGNAEGADALAEAVLDAALAGTRLERAALVRPLGSDEQVEVMDSRLRPGVTPATRGFSRSLIRAAASGKVASLAGGEVPVTGESIAQMGLQAAVCAPVQLGTDIAAMLYVDSIDPHARLRDEAREFCGTVAHLLGLAWSSAKRAEAERRNAAANAQLQAAREAQRLLLPPTSARVGGIDYACIMEPGVIVAGDLFDVVPLPDGRVAAFLGDVTGKGVGASLLMAAAQSCLHAALTRYDDPAEAIREANRYVCDRSAARSFITLWLAIFDPAAGTAQVVDAGHGHVIFCPAGAAPRTLRSAGGPPIGIDPEFPYPSETIALATGDRVVMFSDGVVEQPSREGEQFGVGRALAALGEAHTPQGDVDALLAAMHAHADNLPLADDTTVASCAVVDVNAEPEQLPSCY